MHSSRGTVAVGLERTHDAVAPVHGVVELVVRLAEAPRTLSRAPRITWSTWAMVYGSRMPTSGRRSARLTLPAPSSLTRKPGAR